VKKLREFTKEEKEVIELYIKNPKFPLVILAIIINSLITMTEGIDEFEKKKKSFL